MMPDLVGADPVPAAALSLVKQEVDGGQGGAVGVKVNGADPPLRPEYLAVMAALRVGA